MYLMPYGGDLFDEFKSPFDDFFKKIDVRPEFKNVMSTDIVEKENGLEMTVDLPGVKKEDIKIELNKGYLIITASSDVEKEEKDTPNFVHCYIEKNENQTTEDLIEKAEKFAQQKADTLSVVMENEAKETGSPRYTYGDIQVWHYTLQSGQMTAVVDINTGEIQKNEEMHKALFRNSNKNSQKNDITLE